MVFARLSLLFHTVTKEIMKSVSNSFNAFFVQMIVVYKIFVFIIHSNNTIVVIDIRDSVGKNYVHIIVKIIRKSTVSKI